MSRRPLFEPFARRRAALRDAAGAALVFLALALAVALVAWGQPL